MRSRKLAQLLSRDALSGEFLDLARAYQSKRQTKSSWGDLINYCESRDCGCSSENVDALADPDNWSQYVISEKRKPRIALNMRINQRGSFVVSHNSASDRIVFPEDFSRRFWAEQAISTWHRAPDPCNLMWVPEFGTLLSSASVTRNPVAQSLVAAIHARAKELISDVAQKLTLVASSTTELIVEDGQIIRLRIETSDEMRRLEDELRYRE